jgi:hypothetical protein
MFGFNTSALKTATITELLDELLSRPNTPPTLSPADSDVARHSLETLNRLLDEYALASRNLQEIDARLGELASEYEKATALVQQVRLNSEREALERVGRDLVLKQQYAIEGIVEQVRAVEGLREAFAAWRARADEFRLRNKIQRFVAGDKSDRRGQDSTAHRTFTQTITGPIDPNPWFNPAFEKRPSTDEQGNAVVVVKTPPARVVNLKAHV